MRNEEQRLQHEREPLSEETRQSGSGTLGVWRAAVGDKPVINEPRRTESYGEQQYRGDVDGRLRFERLGIGDPNVVDFVNFMLPQDPTHRLFDPPWVTFSLPNLFRPTVEAALRIRRPK